jgi:hypothetical protein
MTAADADPRQRTPNLLIVLIATENCPTSSRTPAIRAPAEGAGSCLARLLLVVLFGLHDNVSPTSAHADGGRRLSGSRQSALRSACRAGATPELGDTFVSNAGLAYARLTVLIPPWVRS